MMRRLIFEQCNWKMNCVINKIPSFGRLIDVDVVLDEAVTAELELEQNNIVVNKMLRETEIETEEYVARNGLSTSDHMRYSIFYRSMTLGLITGAAGIMCGYFDSRIPGSSFARLSVLLASDHPINAIRFYKMQMSVFELLHSHYRDEKIVSALLSEQNTYSLDIFMHKNGVKDFNNCYWLPVHTKEAQEFIAKLEEGWNQIHDSLQRFALLPLPEKYSNSELKAFDESV